MWGWRSQVDKKKTSSSHHCVPPPLHKAKTFFFFSFIAAKRAKSYTSSLINIQDKQSWHHWGGLSGFAHFGGLWSQRPFLSEGWVLYFQVPHSFRVKYSYLNLVRQQIIASSLTFIWLLKCRSNQVCVIKLRCFHFNSVDELYFNIYLLGGPQHCLQKQNRDALISWHWQWYDSWSNVIKLVNRVTFWLPSQWVKKINK